MGSPLERAARASQNTILKELLEAGADATLRESAALVAAAEAANNEAVVILLEHGANIHSQQGVPGKALHGAARYGHISTVKLLLERGADINAFGGEYGYVEHSIPYTYLAYTLCSIS